MLKDQEQVRDPEKPSFGTVRLSRTAGGAALGIAVGSLVGPGGTVLGALVGGVAGATVPYVLSEHGSHHGNGKRVS